MLPNARQSQRGGDQVIPLTVIWTPADVREAAELAARLLTEPAFPAALAPVVDIRTREVLA